MQVSNYLKQRGATLIEMMIAITIGLLLLVALAYSFVTMNATAIARKSQSDLHEEERISMYLLSNFVQQAGYYIYTLNTTATSAFPAATVSAAGQTINFLASQSVAGTTNAGNDILSIRYVADPAFPQGTCSNTSSATVASTYVDTFSISNNALVCTETVGGVTSSRTIVNNVSGMSITYGIDDGLSTTPGSVDIYTNASKLPPLSATYSWSMVKSVNITLTYNYTDPFSGAATTANFSHTIPVMSTVL